MEPVRLMETRTILDVRPLLKELEQEEMNSSIDNILVKSLRVARTRTIRLS